jgi:hypothetical protein
LNAKIYTCPDHDVIYFLPRCCKATVQVKLIAEVRLRDLLLVYESVYDSLYDLMHDLQTGQIIIQFFI